MMKELTKVKKCYGCGVILQCEHADEVGYIPPKHFESDDVFLCQRCFKTHHYSADKLKEPLISSDFFSIIKDAKNLNALIIYVVDVFTFESSFNLEINRALKGMDVILVANKVDLLPKSTNVDKLRKYVETHVAKAELNVRKVILVSSTRNYNIDIVLNEIEKYAEERNVYFIGSVSSGKSSLIKTLLKNFRNETSRFITTSIYPNTTLAVQEIPVSEKTSIFDTPGLSINNSLLGIAEKEVIKQIVPRKEIKPRTYQLSAEQSIMIGGVARLDYLAGRRSSFTFYFSENVKLSRSPLARADKTFNNLITNKKTTPVSTLVGGVKDLDAYEFTTENDKKYDIAWNGLGFVSIRGSGQTIRVYSPRGVAINYNESKI